MNVKKNNMQKFRSKSCGLTTRLCLLSKTLESEFINHSTECHWSPLDSQYIGLAKSYKVITALIRSSRMYK